MPIHIDLWNKQIVMLMQSMLGAISPNFRMITLTNVNSVWELRFVLEKKNDEDLDEINDIVSEYVSLQDGKFKYRYDVEISDLPLNWPKQPVRVVYKRKEFA